jgi:hypothetical protein
MPFNSTADVMTGSKVKPINLAPRGSATMSYLLGKLLLPGTGQQSKRVCRAPWPVAV